MVDYEIFQFVYSFFIELSCVYFDTYKRSPKEFFSTCSIFILVPYMSTLTRMRMNVMKKPQLRYVLEKEDSCVFALLLRKHSGAFIKILQLVHARNRPIQQLFVPFPVE